MLNLKEEIEKSSDYFLPQKGAKNLETSSTQANRLRECCYKDPSDLGKRRNLGMQDAQCILPTRHHCHDHRTSWSRAAGPWGECFKKRFPASEPLKNFPPHWYQHTPKNEIHLSKTESLLISSSSYYDTSFAVTKTATTKIQTATSCPVTGPKCHVCKRY